MTHIIGLAISTSSNLPSADVVAIFNRLLGLGVAKAEELLVAGGTDPALERIAELGFKVHDSRPCDPEYSPNTLYIVGTDAKGKPVVQSTRSSSDAAKDFQVMEGALELSQAVELRQVDFKEHKVGALLVRPAKRPLREDDLLLYKLLDGVSNAKELQTTLGLSPDESSRVMELLQDIKSRL